MLRALRAFFIFLFVFLTCSIPQVHAQKPCPATTKPRLPANLPTSIHDYRFSYGITTSMVSLSFKAGRTTVLVPKQFDSPQFRKTLKLELDDAYLCVEPLGLGHAPLTICIVENIEPTFTIKERGLQVFGVTFKHGNLDYIAVTRDGLRFDNLAHELCHLLQAELGHNHPWWLEEGIAECFESWTYVAEDHLQALRNKQSATMDELENYKPLQGNEEGIRATAWAIAYYLMVLKQYDWNEFAKKSKGLDPKVAIAAVLKALP